MEYLRLGAARAESDKTRESSTGTNILGEEACAWEREQDEDLITY
jgi:hypothetical protein